MTENHTKHKTTVHRLGSSLALRIPINLIRLLNFSGYSIDNIKCDGKLKGKYEIHSRKAGKYDQFYILVTGTLSEGEYTLNYNTTNKTLKVEK